MDPESAYINTFKFKGKPSEYEIYLLQSPNYSYLYAYTVVRGRWMEGEKIISTHPRWAYIYARNVIRKRWPEAEKVIATDPDMRSEYLKFLTTKGIHLSDKLDDKGHFIPGS